MFAGLIKRACGDRPGFAGRLIAEDLPSGSGGTPYYVEGTTTGSWRTKKLQKV